MRMFVTLRLVLSLFLSPPLVHLHICVKLELVCLVADCEVALCDPGFPCLKGHLVASEPALVAEDRRSAHRGPGDVKVHVTADVDMLPLVTGLNLTTLFPASKE